MRSTLMCVHVCTCTFMICFECMANFHENLESTATGGHFLNVYLHFKYVCHDSFGETNTSTIQHRILRN